MKTQWFILLALAVLTLGLFWPATGYDFINLDDETYVYENRYVSPGLSRDGVKWAFTNIHQDWWLPLLWISYMADIELFGFGPFGHHLVNILLHTANVLLLFWALFRMTGSRWRSALVAALFAVHPLRVESVVWIAARKDVLSGFFWMLCMVAFARYAEKPRPVRLWLVAVLMLMGLMSKVILITFPLAMLLLDFWPLKRARAPFTRGAWSEWRPLIAEKWPLFVLTAAFSVLNFMTHWMGKANYAGVPGLVRICLIPANYLSYIFKIVWPVRLAVVYPELDVVSVPLLGIALVVLGALTWVFARRAEKYPFLIVGWLWFLGNLFPMVRGVRLGIGAMADRFTYLPGIGLFIVLAWAMVECLPAFSNKKAVLTGCALALIAASAAGARSYMPYWRSSEPLYLRTLELTRNNWLVPVNLGAALVREERYEEAARILEKSLKLAPYSIQARIGLGLALDKLNRRAESDKYFRQAVELARDNWEMLVRIGESYVKAERFADAAPVYQQALRLKPGHKETMYDVGLTLTYSGRTEEGLDYLLQVQRKDPRYHRAFFIAGKAYLAMDRVHDAISNFQRAVELVPEKVEYLSALAVALVRVGRKQEAFEHMRRAVALAPESPELLNNFAWMLATDSDESARDGDEALTYAVKAADISERKNAGILDTLSVSYAAAGRFDEAVETAVKAFELAREKGDTNLQAKIGMRVKQFKSERPWVE